MKEFKGLTMVGCLLATLIILTMGCWFSVLIFGLPSLAILGGF